MIDRLPLASQHTQMRHYSFDHHFYLMLQNHFSLVNSRSPKGSGCDHTPDRERNSEQERESLRDRGVTGKSFSHVSAATLLSDLTSMGKAFSLLGTC